MIDNVFNALQPDVALLYFYIQTFRFSDVFRRYRKATPGCNGLMQSVRFKTPNFAFIN